MRALFLVAVLVTAFGTVAQEPKKGLGLDIGTSTSFVFSEPVETDNWIGSRSLFGASLDATVNWTFPKDRAAVGLGGGLFFWGDRMLYPVFLHVSFPTSLLCDDCVFSRGIWPRITYEGKLGTVLGNVETTAGPLHPDFLSELGLRYRLGTSTRTRFHAGIRLSMFTLRGPYQMQVEGVWQDSKPNFLTAGPALWMTF